MDEPGLRKEALALVQGALQKRVEMLSNPDNPRNLQYYLSLPDVPPDTNGFGEGIHLLNNSIVLLLAGVDQWRILAGKAARWHMAEFDSEAHSQRALHTWDLLEWAACSFWLLGNNHEPPTDLLWQAHEESASHGNFEYTVEQCIRFISRGRTDMAVRVWDDARNRRPLASRSRRLTSRSACGVALAMLLGKADALSGQLRTYLRTTVRSEMAEHNFAGSLVWATLYHAMFVTECTPEETVRNLAFVPR